MSDRDMFYNSYGYGGFMPMNGNSLGMVPEMVGMSGSGMNSGMSEMVNSYSASQFNDINERVSRLERQVKRLEQRITRLETPYASGNSFINNEPDNNMYMM